MKTPGKKGGTGRSRNDFSSTGNKRRDAEKKSGPVKKERSREAGKEDYSPREKTGSEKSQGKNSNRGFQKKYDPSEKTGAYKKDKPKDTYSSKGSKRNDYSLREKAGSEKHQEEGSKRTFRKKFDEKEKSGAFKKENREYGSKKDSDPGKKSGFEKFHKDDKRSPGRKFEEKGPAGAKTKEFENKGYSKKKVLEYKKKHGSEGSIRLNKYIANSGICSRREADTFIEAGLVSVNGKTITELGYKVDPGDLVKYAGETIRREKPVYILLNKPKNYLTTMDDPSNRKTVMELIEGACKERVYPVGRLDRNTTGLLLLTNDGDLAKKLTHPKYGVTKIYHVETDKAVKKADMLKMVEGIELEDGEVKVDEVSYVAGSTSKKEVGLVLHSGKYRVVRRIFEHLGLKVEKLDRVSFAGLTKKNLPRGKWRMLTDKEVSMLKMGLK